LVEVGHRIGSLVFDPVANRLYCALVDDIDEEEKRPSRSLAVIDCDRRTLVTTLAGRADPNSGSVARDSLTGDIYLTNPSTPRVTVVDPKTASLAGTVTFGCRPGPIVYSPRSGQLYCAEEWGTTLFSIDVPANRLRRSLALGRGTGTLCLNSDSSLLYCVGGGDANYLTVIDCRNDSILCAVRLHGWTGAACFNPADGCIYCAEGDSIAMLDARSGARVAEVQVHDCGQPCSAPDLNRVFASSVSMVVAIDGRTHTAAARIAVGNEVRALYYDSVGRKLYCSNGGSDNISVVDAEPCKYLRTILTLGSPDELVGNAAMRRLYCGQSDARSVAVIDTDRDSVVAQVKVGLQPDHLVAVPGLLLCASRDGARAMVIDTKTLRVADSLSIGGNADHMVWVPQLRRLYVANSAGSSITVLEDTRP
jgi:DNA-binding beta-propeller fold protein YncE